VTAPLVIGYGNRRRGDDAAGPLAVDALRERGGHGLRLDVFEGDGAGLVERWTPEDAVLIIDAVLIVDAVSGREPGALHVFSHEDLLGGAARCVSTHGLGLLEAVRLARALGRMPAELWILGVEAASFEPGAEPSPAVRRGAREAARLAVERWGIAACTS